MGDPGTDGDASSIDAVVDAARDLLSGLAAQIDDVASLLGPHSGGLAEGLATELSGELSVLFAEVGELLARLIATLIAILEALVKMLRADPADGSGPPATTYQDITVAIGRGDS
jgi:hypothetical protein